MEREDAFAKATALISNLPKNTSAVDFWDTPRVDRAGDRQKWHAAANRLEQIGKAVDCEVASYFLSWASDAAVGLGDLRRGYELSPIPRLGARHSSRADGRLDLKLALDMPVDARDIIALFGPKVTAFGKRNIEAIELHVQVQLDLLVASGQPIRLQAWAADAYRHPSGYSLFNGHPTYLTTSPPAGWHFSRSPTALACCEQLVREAENTWREECDLPRVGEGWVAETQLYYALKSAFPDVEVVQHYRSGWLGKQHLDVGIPRLLVGLEYQGAQHDQPVAFFGGQEAFTRTVERDRRKLVKCRRHGWRLIYVREGYRLGDLIADILTL